MHIPFQVKGKVIIKTLQKGNKIKEKLETKFHNTFTGYKCF